MVLPPVLPVAWLYLLFSSEEHGCFTELWEPVQLANGTTVPAALPRRFSRALLFSIETMMTIGYGVDDWKTVLACGVTGGQPPGGLMRKAGEVYLLNTTPCLGTRIPPCIVRSEGPRTASGSYSLLKRWENPFSITSSFC